MDEIMNRKQAERIAEALMYSEVELYHGYGSSAQTLDELLQINGVKTDFRFAHDYILPKGYTPETYEKRVLKYSFYESVSKDRDPRLKGAEYSGYKRKVKAEYPLLRQEMYDEIEWLKERNPKLLKLEMKTEQGRISFLRGVCYKFAPEDIEWFNQGRFADNVSEGVEKLDELMRCENMMLTYRLCPEHQRRLRDLVLETRRSEQSMSMEEKKQQMLRSYSVCQKHLGGRDFSPAEALDRELQRRGLVSEPVFAREYKLPQGMDYSKLGDKINEISFYMEMKRPDTVLLHSAAPRPLLDSVRRSCLDELSGRKEEWEQLTVEIRELNPELKDWNIDNGRMFLQGVYAKLLPQDIYRGYYFSENDGASEFVKQMREKGVYLGFVPSRQSRAKLSGLLEQERVSFFQKLANRLSGR